MCAHAHTPLGPDDRKNIHKSPGQNFIHYQYDIERSVLQYLTGRCINLKV